MTKNKDNKLYIKFRYHNVERLWLKVSKETDKYDFGTVSNDPTEPGLKFGDKRRVLKPDFSYSV